MINHWSLWQLTKTSKLKHKNCQENSVIDHTQWLTAWNANFFKQCSMISAEDAFRLDGTYFSLANLEHCSLCKDHELNSQYFRKNFFLLFSEVLETQVLFWNLKLSPSLMVLWINYTPWTPEEQVSKKNVLEALTMNRFIFPNSIQFCP